jgi:hypothetical protein
VPLACLLSELWCGHQCGFKAKQAHSTVVTSGKLTAPGQGGPVGGFKGVTVGGWVGAVGPGHAAVVGLAEVLRPRPWPVRDIIGAAAPQYGGSAHTDCCGAASGALVHGSLS